MPIINLFKLSVIIPSTMLHLSCTSYITSKIRLYHLALYIVNQQDSCQKFSNWSTCAHVHLSACQVCTLDPLNVLPYKRHKGACRVPCSSPAGLPPVCRRAPAAQTGCGPGGPRKALAPNGGSEAPLRGAARGRDLAPRRGAARGRDLARAGACVS